MRTLCLILSVLSGVLGWGLYNNVVLMRITTTYLVDELTYYQQRVLWLEHRWISDSPCYFEDPI